jgi:hypothetical protein
MKNLSQLSGGTERGTRRATLFGFVQALRHDIREVAIIDDFLLSRRA